MKIVINTQHGGFNLSHEAVMRYAEVKGLALYPEDGQFGVKHYHLVPPEEQMPGIAPKPGQPCLSKIDKHGTKPTVL